MLARLIQTIDTSLFGNSSPDPAGITFLSNTGNLIISDSEVEETVLWAGVNLQSINTNGAVSSVGSTVAFSAEPTGLTYDFNNSSLFISDDSSRRVYNISSGNDEIFGTTDDYLINQFNTRSFGSADPEGIALNSYTGNLFIADGKDNRIYEVTTNGSLINSFDTASFGLFDPEGIDFNIESGNFFIVGQPSDKVFEVNINGDLVQKLDISTASAVKPAGLALAPSSDNVNNLSLYIADRGIDESEDIYENDGKVYEFSLENSIYATSRDTIVLNGISFDDEDIFAYNPHTGNWSQYLDGSDLNLASNDIDAVHINDDGSVLFSLNKDSNITDLGSVDDSDILRFTPTSTGDNTSGYLEVYFDGSDVGLNRKSEDIDAISLDSNGDILISTNGSYSINGLSGTDEDVLIFSPQYLGESTAGSFSLYIDGSDIGLDTNANEDIKGISAIGDDELIFSTLSDFEVEGVMGTGGDLLSFSHDSIGNDTSGIFQEFSNSVANGFGDQIIADFSIV